MKLLIVESPSKAKTIGKYLGPGYTVKASVGHVRDLPKSNKDAIDIEGGFVPRYVVSPGKEKVVAELTAAARKADEILLATDPDREGEAIAWHLARILEGDSGKHKTQSTKTKQSTDQENKNTKKIQRVTYQEITKDAITEALAHPREIDEHLRMAQEARRVLDRLVGYDLSGLIWKKVRYGLSAGRVQSPALRILVEREREIRAFVPESYWVLTALLETQERKNAGKKEQIEFTCVEEPKSEAEAEAIVAAGRKGDWHVVSVDESQASRKPRPPFTTSTLQQAASSRLGMSPSRTMRAAQKLYEQGLISYMRTDSVSLSKQFLGEAAHVIEKTYGRDYLEVRAYKTKAKNAQEAHEAIRPTHAATMSAGVSAEEQKLYRLIWARTIASQMKDAALLKTKIVANVLGEKGSDAISDPVHSGASSNTPPGWCIPDFTANGSRVVFDGWLKADSAARGEDVELPKVAAEDPLKLISLDSEGKQTQPPNRYSEAGLVKELEKRGIGRPSTYASIIQTLLTRAYVEKVERALKPTDTGELVSGFLEEHFGNIVSDSFTAEMENKLDEIADGTREYAATLSDFYTPFSKQVSDKGEIAKITDLGEADASIKCPICGKGMIIKLGKNGKFLSCADFPTCAGARTFEGEEIEGPKETGEACPDCTKGMLVERSGRFGRFVACNRYPKCKYIKKDAEIEGAAPAHTGVLCPKCKKGHMAERKGRFGVFYGCDNYPACKHIVKTKPTGEVCGYPREGGPCPELMIEGTKTIPDRCADKACPRHNPHRMV